MNTNEIKKLYTALRGKGYSTYDLGDETTFETKMSNKSNRKELYDWVSSRGDFRMGDYEKYEERLTSPMQPEGTTTDPIRGISMAPVEQIEQTEFVVQPQQEEDEYQPLSFGKKMLLKGMSRSAKNLGVRNNPAQAVIDADKEMRELEENRQQFMDETQLQEVRQANRQQVRDLQADIQSKLQQTQPQDFIWGGVDQTPQMMVRATRMEMDPNTAKHRTLIAANSALDNAQKIINEADRHGADGTYGSWLETSFAGNAARGLGDKLFDVSTWDMGLTDMKDATILKEALDSYDAGRPLTEEQQALLDAKAVELATQAYFGSYLGRGYKAGQVTAEAIPFMIEMAINPASAMGKSAGNMMARYALKRFGKGVAEKALTAGARVAGDIAGASTMAATTGIGRVASDATERMAGQVQFATDEDNRSVFAGYTEGEDPATAVAKAFGATTIENYSEMFGNYFSPILGGAGKMFRKGADKIGAGKVVKMLDDVAASDLARIVSDFEKNAQWSGKISEYAEEVAGGIMNAIFVGDQTLDTAEGTGVFNLDQNIDTFLGVALLGGAMSTVKTVGYPIEKYQANKRVSKADKAGLSAFHNAEAWEAVKEKISVDDIEQRAEALTDIRLDNNMSEEQKVSAFKYVAALQNRDGVRMGVMKHNQDPTVPREQVEVEQSYDNGYTLETSQEMNDAKVQLDAQAENLRSTWGSDADQDIDEILGEDPYALIREVDDEQRGAIIDYLNAKATYDGMIQRVRDDIDSQVEANNTLIDQRKNITTGMVVPATLKQDDKAVFVKSGNVVLNDDGSVNNQESSESIVVMDEAGHTEMIAPSAILTLGQTEEAEALKATQAQQIAEQYATMKGDQIDGILPFVQGDTYNIMDEQGAQHSVQVVADNGDGSVQVAMDGTTEAVTMTKGQIQTMSQAFNKARAVAYNEQKKAQEVAQQEHQAEQKAAEGQPAVVKPVQKPVIPTLKDGSPDYNAMDADMFTEQYVSQFGEELTEKIARNNIKEADKAIASIQKQIDGITDPNKLPALYAKQQESEAKKAKYTTVIVNLGLSVDASEDNASRVQRMKKEATPRIAQLFPDGLPNVESVVMADIATGNKIRWTNKEVNGTIVSKGLGAELGLADSKAERTRRISMIGKDAPTPEEYAESLRERLDAMGVRYDESELRNQILNVYASVDTPKNAWEWLENMSANMQADQEGLDYEEEQMRRAYEQGIAGHPQDMDLVQPEPEIPSQEEYNQIAQEFANGKAKEVVAPALQYELSDEVDENGRQFVKSSTGAIEFGQVDAESGLAYAPILLSEGIITNKATNDGYGLVHIEARHGDQIRKAGYNTVVEFIEDVAKNYEVIKEGNIRDGRNTYLLQLKDKHNNTLIVELSGDGTYWNINTAGVFKTSYGKNRKEVYNRHTTAKQPAETIEASRNSEPSGTQKFPSMVTASTLVSSDSKDTTSEPKSQEVAEKILQAEAETNIEPSEAQKEAGNYKKGHVSIDGLNITIENPKDTERSGVDENGQKWSVKMNNTYGYIRRTEGKDGDHIDLFLSDHIDDWNGNVFVVDQVKPDGSFDEHKVMYGFDTIEEAEQAYMSNYSIGWKGLGAITGTSKENFKKWLDSSRRKTKPFAEYKAVQKAEGQSVSAERHNLADFKEGDVVRDYYDKKLYRIKKHSKNGVSTIAMLDEEGNEVYTTQMNAHSNSRYNLANAFVKTEIPTISQESEKTAEQPNVQQEIQHLEEIKNYPGADKKAVQKEIDRLKASTMGEPQAVASEAFSIEPAQYTNKRGKILDMHLVKFADTLTKEQQRAAKELAKAEKGWYDREQGGFMMRSEESAKRLADTILNNDDAVSNAQPVSLNDIQSVSNGEVVFTEPQQPKQATEGKNAPVWQYSISVDSDGFTTLRREDISGAVPVVDAFFTKHADEPQEMLDILRNPLNGMQEILDVVGTTLENQIATRELNRKIEAERRRKYEELRQNGVNGFKIGDKVLYTPEGRSRKPIEATIHDFEEFGANNPVLDVGLAPIMYETTEWKNISKDGQAEPLKQGHSEKPISSTQFIKRVQQASNGFLDAKSARRTCVDTIVKGSRGHIDIDLNYIINVAIDAGMTASDAINFFEAEILPRMPWEYVAKYNLFNVENLRGKLRAKDSASLSNQEEQAINPSGNKLVSDERYAELRERMRKKLGGQMNIGIDPEILAIGTEMAVYHLEKGARKFTEYAKAMIADLGDAIRPYLKAFYNGARNLPEVEGGEIATDMTPYNEVQLFDVANFDKANIDATATAETVVRETEVQQEVDIAQERIKKTRAPRSKKEKKSVTSQEPSLFGEPQNESENGTDENSAANNRGTELGSEELPEAQSVGTRTPVQNTAGDRQSKRMRLGDSSRESRSGSQYDVNKNYSNEEISEIVSSITDIVDGKVVITGAVTDDIKAVCRQYKSGGIAKKGRGILDEYYTDGKIVDAVSMLIAPYFKNTSAIRVLEPSVGVGNFIEATRNMRTSDVVAFEINDTTARIAKVLYPNVDVNLRSFETEFIDDSGNKKPLPKKFNLVIGNPPYGSHRGLYKGLGEESKIARYEDYFVKRSLDVLEDGGVLAMVLPSSWIDRHTKYGGYTIEAAYRLPSGAFEATQVGTDIVVLKKDSSVPTSEHTSYFEQHPDRILGEVKQRKGRYGRLEEYVEGNIDAALEAIERDHAKQLAARLDVDETSDNLNDIQMAIEETGSVDNAEAIVKNAQEEATTTKDEQTPIEEEAQSKYKVNLNRSAETAPTSAQFTHEFSEGEIEAFEDTNYDGTINDPTTHAKYANFVGERYVHDFYYAEGDIYAKLAQLEDDRDIIIRRYGVEQYEKQKRLLESVLPKRKGLDEITISPNTAFVKNLTITTESGRESLKNLFEAFCRKLPYRAFGDSTQWEVIGYINNEQVYGQDKQRNQLIRERRKRVANELFVKFLNEELSDDGKRQVVAAFNREYNSVYRPDYSKVPMFSTINKDFKGKPLKLTSVQLAGIGRMTVKGVGVLAHEVGFGKTLSGILAMHEAMTRGFASKPLIVVPNDNILKQWVETMKEVLPESTVNVLGNLGASYDLTGFKVNDGEFTIVTYEGLKAMSFSDSTYNHLAAKFSYITEDLNKHQSERDYQKEIEKRNELKGKMKRGVKTSYGFEDFGFDWLTVDEVHNANHIVSKVRLDKSIASDFRSQSQRTSDLGLKTWLAAQYIQEENNGRNVLLLSATPFTNKPLEYYSILSLVANDMLRRKGFFNVDQFFATFMEADNELEIAANGRPVQKTNVRRFRNNGLFQQLLSEFIDIKGEEDNPDLVRPTRQDKEYKIAQNELTAEAMAEVQDLLSDNEKVLQGIGHARAAAFSPYATSLIGRRPKNHKEFVKNSPKIDATIKLIEQNKKDRPDAGQIIYSEVGVEFFPMIRDYLVHESGFKSNEVRIITGATSNNERVNIQTAFNKGEVKVVIGSPAIKEGLNLQENTTDMYILSLPWNFTQLRQIEGRGWRQGNKWENIRINYMLTNDSVDVFMLQRLQLKQGLYNEAMKSGAESLDVSDIDTAELKTQLITDPAVRAEIVTVQEREKLQQEKTQIEADLSFVTRKFEGYNKLVDALNSRKRNLEQFKSFAARSPRDEYWSKRAEDEARKVLQTENEIEQEKERLRTKGVNIDDIERQVKQSQSAIEDIQKRIDGLGEYQKELTEKYRREDEAKANEQGDNLSTYIKERKKENQSGFYKIRPKDEGVRFRVIDSKKPFDELEERYEKIDKNNAEALNAWRDEKAAVIQSVGTAIADDLGFEPPILVFNGANEESLQEAYNHYKNLYAELGMDEPYSYEAFSEKVNKKDVLGVYWPMIDIITSNTANYDYITDYKQVRGTLLHENAHRVIRSAYTETDLESIWEEAISAQHPVAMMVDRVYGKKSNAGKGNELLAKIIGYIARDRADELSAYIKGGKEIEEKLLNKAGYSLPLGKFALSEILNTFRDDYKRRGDQNLRGGTLGVRGISRGHAASRIRRRAVKEAAELFASQLNTPIRIVEDVNTITDNNAKLQERKRNAKGWFDNKANEVVVVLPNATSVEDVRETIFHEVVGHKGMRELVGKERFNAFLDKVYAHASDEMRRRIAQRAAKLGWDFHEATEEYIAELAEQGFEERENRNFFEVVRDLFLDMLRRAKIALGFNISDNDIRYMLWRTYQMQRSKGAMAVAEDMVMQQKLGVGNFRARQVSEEEQIATKAKKNGSYLKAPNGKDTNLTPEQWVTVRTKAFKRWFGDWEKAARIEKLRTSESASIVGNEIESSDDMKQYRKNALEYGKSLRGEYRNADTGRTIIINRDSLTEVLHHDGNNVAHIQSIAAIPQMVERGIFITSEPVSADASEKLKNAKEVQYYVCGLNIGGVAYTVKFVVAEYENGERYYDHSLTQIEKGDLLNRAELSSTVADSKSPISGIKDKRLVSILQTNSSKIVDANGEPLVVEHSTWNEDFHTFDISKLGESSGDNGIYGSGFYFGNVGETEMYGDRVIRSYLNVKNPFALPEDNMMQFFDYLVENFDKEGLRDIVVTNSGKSSSIGAIIDAIKEVKANHSRGEYNELIVAMGQYWTPSSAEDRVIEQTIFRKVGFAFYRSLTPFIEHNIGQIEFSEALRNAGYDGVIYDNHEYVAFYPNQIKLADGSNTSFDSDNDDIRFRDGGSTPSPKKPKFKPTKLSSEGIATGVRAEYEKLTKTNSYQSREALQDGMLSLRRYQEMATKAHGKTEDDIKDWENAYMAENQLSSRNDAEIRAFDRTQRKELEGAVSTLMKKGFTYEEINDYMMLKHGIERNREQAVRRAISDKEGKVDAEKLAKWKKAKQRVSNDSSLDSWEKEQRALDKIAQEEFKADLYERDYSGLTAMHPDAKGKVEDAVEMSYDEVNAFEQKGELVNTNALWKAVRASTMYAMNKMRRSSLISKETMDDIVDMYSYYVPLRGFDETTSDEVYGYMNNEPKAFNAPIRKAKGRATKADAVLPYIVSAAHSAIMQGNRNVFKLRFLNFVEHYPTDLVTKEKMWVEFDKSKDEWVAKFPDLKETDSAEDVARKREEFEAKMKKLSEEHPESVKEVKQSIKVPYRVLPQFLQQHQIIVKRNGVDVVLTVNGSPRLAMAINGIAGKQAIGDKIIGGAVGRGAEKATRYLSGIYTQYSPDFMISNFFRDAIYTNTMVWLKESPQYALKFHQNMAICNPTTMVRLFYKLENGTLDMSNELEREFNDFIMNGGETGYAKLASIEELKKDIERTLDPSALDKTLELAKKLSAVNRAVENVARFAAYRTSRQSGRSISRSVNDAKEISVNFNRKGAGDFFYGAKDQTTLGKAVAAGAGIARPFYAFFNASMQGLANVAKIAKRKPVATGTLGAGLFILGALLASMAGDDEEEYYNLPEYVRRQNIVFKLSDGTWASIPLPIEYRAIYGLGEMIVSVVRGKEDFSDHGLAYKVAEQLAQVLPINVLEGKGGLGTLAPTLAAPVVEVLANEDWAGIPIYRKDNPSTDQHTIPEYQRVYSNTGKGYVAMSKFFNDITGGDEVKKGWADKFEVFGVPIGNNPAIAEHLVDGYLGGPAQFLNKVASSAEMVAGAKEFDWRSVPFANRLVKTSNPNTRNKAINNLYFNNVEEAEDLASVEKGYSKIVNNEEETPEKRAEYAEKLDKLHKSEEWKKAEQFLKLRKEVDNMRKVEGVPEEYISNLKAEANEIYK